jgi:hypothetical protein
LDDDGRIERYRFGMRELSALVVDAPSLGLFSRISPLRRSDLASFVDTGYRGRSPSIDKGYPYLLYYGSGAILQGEGSEREWQKEK